MRGAQRFKVTERTWSGMEGLNADLSFFEDGDELFSIECLVNSGDEGAGHICQRISAFKNGVTGRGYCLSITVSSRSKKTNSCMKLNNFVHMISSRVLKSRPTVKLNRKRFITTIKFKPGLVPVFLCVYEYPLLAQSKLS